MIISELYDKMTGYPSDVVGDEVLPYSISISIMIFILLV